MTRLRLAAMLLGACAAAGCVSSDITVEKADEKGPLEKLVAPLKPWPDPSPRTLQLLRRYALDHTWRKHPLQVLETLDQQVRRLPDRERVYALAELSLLLADRVERLDRPKALRLYLASAACAYFFLFDPELGEPPDVYDPQFRGACGIYNRALAAGIDLVQRRDSRIGDWLHVDALEGEGGGIDMRVTRHGFVWRQEDIAKFVVAADYRVEGLANHYHDYGLGVPLIAIRDRPERPTAMDDHLPEEANFPVTAFLRMDGGVADFRPDQFDNLVRTATLELYDPLRVATTRVGGQVVPLESDLTTPLAYYLSRSELKKFEWAGLLRAGRVQDQTGLYVSQPYERGKIPVVLVHGLWSSPMTWMPVFNDLRGDKRLRDRYQFWFFLYPTGLPIAVNARELRRSLNGIRDTFDPAHTDPAMDQMVLVGHSMGGLLTKMMVQESGETLWHLVANGSLDDLRAPEDDRLLLRESFFFEPQPFVRRVVFIATPHRGSPVSLRLVGRLSSRLIRLPAQLLDFRGRLAQDNPELFTDLYTAGMHNSVDNLSPDDPLIGALEQIPIAAGVTYHSIIGNTREGPLEMGNDGIVPYKSAHLDGAASEYVVPDSHNAHRHPLAILELRRILLEHAAAVGPLLPTAAPEVVP